MMLACSSVNDPHINIFSLRNSSGGGGGGGGAASASTLASTFFTAGAGVGAGAGTGVAGMTNGVVSNGGSNLKASVVETALLK